MIYGLGTIVGGLLLVHRIGVSSLAIGTVAGAFLGPFLLNAVFARRAGTRYRPILDWRDQGLREWVRLSLPLMAGVSLVTADNWIIAHFASAISGAVSLMSYAKQLFTAPMAMLAQAAGAASMPFFASMWASSSATNLPSAWPTRSRALPRWGCWRLRAWWPWPCRWWNCSLSAADSLPPMRGECAAYFAVFCLSMFLWSAQAIYARAFYAAGNTFVPMAAGTVVTLVSLPIYSVHSITGTGPWAWPLRRTWESHCRR